jgi:hypothetical protein
LIRFPGPRRQTRCRVVARAFEALFAGALFIAACPAVAGLSIGSSGTAGGGPEAARSTNDGLNYGARTFLLVNDGSNVINNISLKIQAVRRDAKTQALLETIPLKEVVFENCSANNLPVDCPSSSASVVDGAFQFTLDSLGPGATVTIVAAFPTPKSPDGVVSAEGTINSSTGKSDRLSLSFGASISLGPASFLTRGHVPRSGGQVTAHGLNPTESPLVDALTTVVTIPENSSNPTFLNRVGQIVHGVDPNSCSSMWTVCLHSAIKIPDAPTAASFSSDQPLRVLVKLDASAFKIGAKFANVVVQYKSTANAIPVDVVPCDGDFAIPKLPAGVPRCYLKDDRLAKRGGSLTGFGQIVVLELENGLLLFR